MRPRSGAPCRRDCGRRSPSCRTGVAWRSCCSTWRATRTPRSQASSASPRAPCARRCSTRVAGCAYCWQTGRSRNDARTAAVRSPARSGAGCRAAAGARAGGGQSHRVRGAAAGPGRRPARRRLLGPGAGPLGPCGGGRSGALLAGGGVSRGPRGGGARPVGRGSADRAPHAGGRGGPGLRAGQLERTLRDAEPSYRLGHAAARHDLRRGDRSRRGRPGPLGPRRLRRRARAQPGRRAARGRINRRAGADAGAARLRPRHPAAALYPHGRGVGHGPTALRRAAGGDGLGSDGAPHAGPAGEVSRPYGPASASEGEDRLERKEAMTSVRHHPTAALAAIICLGMPGAVAAQGQAPLEVTLAEAIRRSLDVQPAMVQARGAARNAGAGERSAWGAFLPTVSTSASASRSNTSSFRTGTTDTLPPLYSYSGGLSASLVLFAGFSRFADLRSSAATQDAAVAGLVNQRYQTTLATQQAFFAALADEELVRVGQAQVQRARQQPQTAVNKFQAGAATRSDTLTATVDLGNARLTLLQAQANLATAQANLGRQVGVDQLVRAVPDSAFPPLPDTTTMRASALQTAPLIRQAEAQVSATGAQVWSARSLYWPTVTLSYSNSRTGVSSPELPLFGNYFETFSWRVGPSWTTFNGFRRDPCHASPSFT